MTGYDQLLAAVLTPFGEPAARRERERALTVLLRDHHDRAEADLTAAVRANPTGLQVPAVLELLPFFSSPEVVAVLESLMNGDDPEIAAHAGIALGRVTDPTARSAIERSLASTSAQTTAAAADAAATTTDPTYCAALRNRLTDESPVVRFHVVHALLTLDCLSAEDRAELAQTEHDPDVTSLLA
ncbi:HEAT repeat domain-containing protein [Kribbella pratensis]|uniref:HEAT repeat protein n=1 Tax=Kribbella pratensis TaxID=2512112 RepID=A0A4R8CM39_9ACTN|nr:HEAT repeat domain-containing protein [Kribbella pratensis]TDW77131.1 HEAT repeat protein [Kribbella pratensis]